MRKDIKALNLKERLEAEDFLTLRVGGNDKWSNMNWDDLTDAIRAKGEKDKILEIIIKFRSDRQAQLSAFRWILRGLRQDHVISKIRYDILRYGDGVIYKYTGGENGEETV